ncbi:MAG: glycosyltransferase [Planctomycetaceae bacterium]|nr:glycosyltransferase [Planctomycetaceae bacterium]
MTGLRHQLAPPGSRREALGRMIVQGVLVRARRSCRLVAQRAIRTMRISLGPRFSHKASQTLSTRATSYDVLCLPIIRWDFRFQRPQQLMRQFASDGHRVFYLSDDFLLARPLAIAEIEQNIYDLRLPADASTKAYRGLLRDGDVQRMADGVARLHEANALRQTVIVVQQPYWTPLALELRKTLGCPIVYDCMDDHAGLRREDSLSNLEEQLIRSADLTVATSDRLMAKVAPLARRTSLVRSGVDYDHFASVAGNDVETRECASTQQATAQSLTIGYYGAIAHWFDARLVAELARLRPDWRFELIGNTYSANLEPLKGLPNVQLHGEMPYAQLPRCIARWHCCIIPFVRNPLTEAANPMKVYEMLAAGMPVVAVDLPELRPIAAAGLIELSNDASGFANKIETLVAAQSPVRIAACQEFARQNTWSARYREMSAAIAPLIPSP